MSLATRIQREQNTREQAFLTELYTQFPGSEWDPDESRPLAASTLPASTEGSMAGTLPSGGPGAYDFVVIGSSKWDMPELERWARELGPEVRIAIAPLRRTKAGEIIRGKEDRPQSSTAHLYELRSDVVEVELRSKDYGPRANLEALTALALDGKATLVLVGPATSASVAYARTVLKRFGPRYWPPLVELP